MKYLLLAKSNVKKTKGLTFGLFLLVALASCFLNVFLLINMDFNKNALNVAKKLNTEDAYTLISGDIKNINEDYIKNLAKDEIEEIEITNTMTLISELPYNEGVITANILINDDKVFNNKIGKFEILEEDKSIKDNYLYLPYQFNTSGGYKIGDDFKFTLLNNDYNYKIRGFINSVSLGSNNVGAYQLIFSDDAYLTIKDDFNGALDSILVKYKIKDGIKASKFLNSISDKLITDNPDIFITSMDLDSCIVGRTFLGTIFGALLLIVCAIVVLIVVLMISNNISNFIRENIKTLGALKAIGYTSLDIEIAFFIQFLLITWLGSALGTVLSIFLMQLIGNIMVIQSAIPYTAHFHLIAVVISEVSLLLIVFISLLVLLRKTKKIEPIVALREGLNGNKNKKNIMPLESSNIPLNLNLALKTTFNNIGQNIVVFVVVLFLIMMSTLSLVLYQNFSVHPKFSIMTFEISAGEIYIDQDPDKEAFNYLSNIKGVKNVRELSNNKVRVNDASLLVYILDDPKKLNNQDLVYKGRIPESHDEIVISGKFASDYGYKVNDIIEVKSGSKKLKLKITGFMQSLNNSGQESMILEESAIKLFGENYERTYAFDLEDDAKVEDVFAEMKSQYGPRIKSTINFDEAAKAALNSFKIIALAIVILVFTINMLIILLVLYMLIKTLINKKQKEYGILKALGFTSKQIIMQNAISFVPTILVSTIISSIVSSLFMNKIIAIVIHSFGIMKLSFEIPVLLVIIFGLIFVILSFVMSVLLSRKIKNIEPYKLLIGD